MRLLRMFSALVALVLLLMMAWEIIESETSGELNNLSVRYQLDDLSR